MTAEADQVGSADDGEGDSQLADEQVYEVLGNQRRLLAIELLAERGHPVDEGDLATQVACLELGVTPDTLTSQQRKRVYVSLHQCHLPKLQDYGVIQWSKEGYVSPTPVLEEVANQHHWGNPSGLRGAISRWVRGILAS